jgi:hypothetical protein
MIFCLEPFRVLSMDWGRTLQTRLSLQLHIAYMRKLALHTAFLKPERIELTLTLGFLLRRRTLTSRIPREAVVLEWEGKPRKNEIFRSHVVIVVNQYGRLPDVPNR